MKKQSILNLNISSINDITKIEESCKYIDLDLTNYSSEVINYFLKNGSNYMYSEIINNKKGYVYVDYEIFARGEHIINLIYQNMPQNLNELEYINGEIWANIFQQDLVVRISPVTGEVIGKPLNFTNYVPKKFIQSNEYVLNGLAFDPNEKKLYLTGKCWPVIYVFKLS